MKKYKPTKRLPPYLNSAVEQIFEEMWQCMHEEALDDLFISKQDKKIFKTRVLKMLNKARYNALKRSE